MKLIVNHYSKAMLFVVALLLCNFTIAQRTIQGTVTDGETGEPLIGSNILVVGTSTGTVTDFDGKYSLELPQGATQLEFSYTGYQTQTINIGASDVINVQLSSGELLDEIVVIGYGSVKKEDATGSVLAVSDEDFNKGALVSGENLLTGKVAGVQITPSAQPGGGASIRIRGGTSINASNDPLYVVDGVPVGNGGNLAFYVNPNDIQTFTVLKDASATAIYGSRGANGVIMITTKRGKKGSKPRFSFNAFNSWASIPGDLPVLSPAEFRNVVTFRRPDRLEDVGPERTNWLDEVSQTAYGQSYDMSVTGGGENFGYRVSANYQNIDGVIKPYNAERIGLNLAFDLSILNEQLDISTNLKGNFNKRDQERGVIGNAWGYDPTQPVFDLNNVGYGGYFEYGVALGPRNPVSQIEQQENLFEEFGSIGNIEFDFKPNIIPGLSAKLNLGYDIDNNDSKFFSPTTFTRPPTDDRTGNIFISNGKNINLLLDAYLTYKFDLNVDNAFEVLAGYSYQDFTFSGNSINAWDIDTDIFGVNNLSPATEFISTSGITDNRLISFFGRLNYTFKDKYLLTATVRRDGSSRFGPTNRWGTFPSAALGWRILQEPFAAGLSDIFSDLKLRVGYGVTGNQEIGDFQFLPLYAISDSRARFQFGDEFVTTLRPNGYDAGLKWEETTSWNFGLDFGFSNGRISGTIEYYYKNTDDLLFTVNVPAGTNLTDRVLTNIGELENSGIELTLNAAVVTTPDFTFDLSFNGAYNQNEIKVLDGEGSGGIQTGGISGGVGSNVQLLQVGFPVNSFHLFEQKYDNNGSPLIDGVDHNEDGNIDNADMYVDQNGDGIVNDQDRRLIDQAAPDMIFGLTSNLSYKNFDLAFTLRANIGNSVYNNNASNWGHYSRLADREGWLNNLHHSVLLTGFSNPQYFSDYYLEDGSFLRMDNITLGYNFTNLPAGMNLRLYGTAENVFVLTEYSGLDPEIGNGIENNPFPRQRRIVLGATLGF
jgi:iron complex outermembrane receptor protein